jgi:hypothetical protein
MISGHRETIIKTNKSFQVTKTCHKHIKPPNPASIFLPSPCMTYKNQNDNQSFENIFLSLFFKIKSWKFLKNKKNIFEPFRETKEKVENPLKNHLTLLILPFIRR